MSGDCEQVCFQFYVAGRVQGVFFRASTQKQARALHLKGYAKNLPDGRVEVMACGEPDAVQRLQTWLRKGPPLAEVSELLAAPQPYNEFTGFRVL